MSTPGHVSTRRAGISRAGTLRKEHDDRIDARRRVAWRAFEAYIGDARYFQAKHLTGSRYHSVQIGEHIASRSMFLMWVREGWVSELTATGSSRLCRRETE
jgi:hypothetical protein